MTTDVHRMTNADKHQLLLSQAFERIEALEAHVAEQRCSTERLALSVITERLREIEARAGAALAVVAAAPDYITQADKAIVDIRNTARRGLAAVEMVGAK